MIKNDLIIPVPYDELKRFTQNEMSLFCVKHALYQVPTTELIDFLRNEIIGIPIELGAGNGVVGRSLGIRMVDNYMQTWPMIKQKYDLFNQPTVKYGIDVEEIGGNEAVNKYKPSTVIACWLTQKFQDGKTSDGNMFGVNEQEMFSDGVKKYIHVGNSLTHGNKIMLNIHPCKKYKFPWLISRSLSREDNVIYIFTP